MKTHNYEMFKFFRLNRRIYDSITKTIIESIKEIGYIESKPIIVTKDMYIIDGQHRYEACKKLKLPIFYEICNVDTAKAMILLNKCQKVWKLLDYIESWSAAGIDCYKKLLEFEKKYKLGISNTILICIGSTGTSKRRSDCIRKGEIFDINPKKEEIALFIFSCKTYLPFWKSKIFVHSVVTLFAKTTDKNRKKVLDNIQSLRQQALVVNYLSYYENILNKNNRKNDETRISLF